MNMTKVKNYSFPTVKWLKIKKLYPYYLKFALSL